MLRSDWKFQYLAADLAVAARAKRDHHASRLLWWEGQQQAVIAEVREKGLEVSESIAMQYGSTKAILGGSRNAGAQIVVKDEYQEKLNECATKIHQHGERAKEYDGWLQIMEATNGTKALDLDIHDYLFFFGK